MQGMRNFFRSALCALLLHPVATQAQQLDSSRLRILRREIGSKVLVSTPLVGRIRGRLSAVSADMLRIDQATGQRAISFSGGDTLWVRERLGWTAAGYGAIAGLASASGILLFFSIICGSGDDPCTGFGHAPGFLAHGVVLGAAGGLVIGGWIKHWVRKTP
jgi:hypothetical protein